jgi:hypothetical protein
MRHPIGIAVTLMVVMPGIALAQSPDRPVVELGAQGSKRIRDEGQSLSLRLTVPVTRRTAIEATADIQKSFELKWEGGTRRSAREFSVHWRQTVFTSGRWQVFGLLGGGRNRVEHNYPERILHGHVEPAHTSVGSEFVAHFGPAVQVQLAPWLALRGDLRGTLGERDSGVNFLVGAVIPIGRYRAADPARAPAPATAIPGAKPNPAQSTPLPDKWQRVRPGREVWVTTNTGSLVHGDIVAISDSGLSIREEDREVTIGLDDVRLVEARDGLMNGFLIGAVPGAVAGGQLGSSYYCGSDCGDDTQEAALRRNLTMLGAVGGGIVGGLLGMMVDGLIPGRQTLFRGSTTVVVPVITPTKKAIDVAIRWQ